MSGIKIENLATRAVEIIDTEMKLQDDISTWNHEQYIHETIDSIVPHANWEIIEVLEDDTHLGWESDVHTLAGQDNIFTFLSCRIFEEIEILVLDKIYGWFDETIQKNSEPNYPDDLYDDAQVLASAGWGTDEDYGTYSVSDEF